MLLLYPAIVPSFSRAGTVRLSTPAGDPFELVGVTPDASAAEIRAAYRRRSKSLHPDAGGDPTAFAALVEAYAMLQDDDQRAAAAAQRRDSLDFVSSRGRVYGTSDSLRQSAAEVQDGARERYSRAVSRSDAAEAGRSALAARLKTTIAEGRGLRLGTGALNFRTPGW